VLSFVTEQKVTILWKDRFNIVKKIKKKTGTELNGVGELCDEVCRRENMSGPHVHLKILVGK